MTLNPRLSNIIEWDQINWSAALSFWKKNTKTSIENAYALELGARNGGLSLWLAIQGCRVVCSDLEGPTAEARIRHKKYQVENQISYACIDATTIPHQNEFDIVIFKSMLGGIGRNDRKDLQIKTLEKIHQALKPDGELFFAENLIASPIHKFFRRHFVRWGLEWRYITSEEIKELTQNFFELNYKTVGFLGAFGRTEWQRKVLGLFDKIIFNHITPSSWRYIIIGIARK